MTPLRRFLIRLGLAHSDEYLYIRADHLVRQQEQAAQRQVVQAISGSRPHYGRHA